MKKVIGVLGAALLVVAMFANGRMENNENADLTLANLVSLNSADAECVSGIFGYCTWSGRCYADPRDTCRF